MLIGFDDSVHDALREVIASRQGAARNPAFRPENLIYVKSFPAQPVVLEVQAMRQAEVYTT